MKAKTGQKYACYIRVSTDKQDHDSQVLALTRYLKAQGCNAVWFKDTGTGKNDNRAQLKEMLSRLDEFDKIIVFRIDRLFRSLKHMVRVVEELTEKGVSLVSLHEHIDVTTAVGKFNFNLHAAVAQLQADIIRENTIAGLNVARANGKKLGPPEVVIDIEEAKRLRKEGYGYVEIAKRIGAKKSTVWKRLTKAR